MKKYTENGFSILEVLIAGVIVTLMSLAIASLYKSMNINQFIAQSKATRLQLQNQITNLINIPTVLKASADRINAAGGFINTNFRNCVNNTGCLQAVNQPFTLFNPTGAQVSGTGGGHSLFVFIRRSGLWKHTKSSLFF